MSQRLSKRIKTPKEPFPSWKWLMFYHHLICMLLFLIEQWVSSTAAGDVK